MAPALSRSASEPGNVGTLKTAGMGLTLGANSTTSLYHKMRSEGTFKEKFPHIPPSGRSITVPLADSAERDLQPETYFPLPATPVRERRFRQLSHGPGEIHVHHGLKEQRLPGEEFRYGMRGIKGCTTEQAMKAGQLFGVAEYKNSCAEQVYESSKKEPVGKPFVRGHSLKMLPEGYGNASGVPVDSKFVIFPVETAPDTEDIRAQYRFTHNSYNPGERINRNYNFPPMTQENGFRFGGSVAGAIEGEGMRMALNMDVEDDGNYKQTRLVQKVNEDYRHVQHPKVAKAVNVKQGPDGPPLPKDHRFGIKSTVSDYTAGSCIKGYYTLPEQLPDQDLGRCTKPGRRNVTSETRAFGVPSVRTDIPAPPPGKRSCGSDKSYGDDCGAAALLNPQRFDAKGVPDREFLVRRPREELEALIENMSLGSIDFEALWEEAMQLFDDGIELVSLDAILYVYSQKIDQEVKRTHQSVALGVTA